MSFYTTIDGKFTKLEEMDVACDQFIKNIQYHYDLCKRQNDRLREENAKLKDEHYKDEEIQMWKQKYEEAKQELYYGFGISEKEWEKIKEWKRKHEEEAHGIITDRQRLKAGGAIGGRYSYKFVPTSIGTSGTVICSCGAKFEFQELG